MLGQRPVRESLRSCKLKNRHRQRLPLTFCGIPMFLAVPSRFGIALNLDAVPILPLDADDISLVFSDIGRLDGGLELSISASFRFFFVCVAARRHGNGIGCHGNE